MLDPWIQPGWWRSRVMRVPSCLRIAKQQAALMGKVCTSFALRVKMVAKGCC